MLCTCTLSVAGRPTAYGEDFVRSGAMWTESGPARENGAVAPVAITEEDFQQQLQAMERQQGPYAPALAEPLDSLGRYYLQQGLYLQAVAMYSRALHVVRINDGLYSQRQVPLLRGLFSAYRESGDWQTLDERYTYFFRLLGNGQPPFSELRVRAALEFLRWQREALRLGLPGERRRLLATISLNDTLLDAIAEDVDARYSWQRDLAYSQLFNLYLLEQRVEIRREATAVPGPSDYIGAKPMSVDLEAQQLESLLRYAPRRGVELLQQLMPAAALQGPAEEAAIQLALADWYFWHDKQRRAKETYASVVDTLAAAGEADLIEQWLGGPVELPDNGVFWQPPVAGTDAATVVKARYDITASGRLGNLEVAIVSGNEDTALGRFRRRLASTLFRPRWDAGKAEAVSGVSRVYQLSN